MKKVNLTGKLSLKKEIIAKLNEGQMNAIVGGGATNSPEQPRCNSAICTNIDAHCTTISLPGHQC